MEILKSRNAFDTDMTPLIFPIKIQATYNFYDQNHPKITGNAVTQLTRYSEPEILILT